MVIPAWLLFSVLIWSTINTSIELFMGGNGWPLDGGKIIDQGYQFTTLPAKFSSYFYTSAAGSVTICIRLLCNAESTASITLGSTTLKSTTIPVSIYQTQKLVGTFKTKAGYNNIVTTITGLNNRKGRGLVEALVLNGTLPNINYISDNFDSLFYWGRRGPAGTAWIDYSHTTNITYYHSQIYVPSGYDTVGAYFCAQQFNAGFFGLQINSPTERRLLFSVWSGWDTSNSASVPYEWTVKLIRAGPNVNIGQFTSDGSGAQSYLVFNWTANTTYKFLTKAQPLFYTDVFTGNLTNGTIFTCWFNDPNNKTSGGWRLIASWLRPFLYTYVTDIATYLENFIPEYGNLTKIGYFGNQWAFDSSNKWKEITKFDIDDDWLVTDLKRRDIETVLFNGNQLLLKANGFFDCPLYKGKKLVRNANKKPPIINFATLPF